MAKYKPCNDQQMVMLPISLQDQILPGTLEYTISELVEKRLDLSVFDARYNNDEVGAAAIHPKILLKVILLAYAKGMISSRQIERACHENILFIALSYGYAPDHSTIAAFVSSMQEEVQTIFSNVLQSQTTPFSLADFVFDADKQADVSLSEREGVDLSCPQSG